MFSNQQQRGGGWRSAKPRRAFAEKFGLGRKSKALTRFCRVIEICRKFHTFWKILNKTNAFFWGRKRVCGHFLIIVAPKGLKMFLLFPKTLFLGIWRWEEWNWWEMLRCQQRDQAGWRWRLWQEDNVHCRKWEMAGGKICLELEEKFKCDNHLQCEDDRDEVGPRSDVRRCIGRRESSKLPPLHL